MSSAAAVLPTSGGAAVLTLCSPSDDLARKLQPLGEQERSVLLRLKEEECRRRNLPFSGQLQAWDTRYYMTQVPDP